MASHLQATAGSISRAQQKTLPTAQAVASPVDELAQSLANGVNISATNSVSISSCGFPAAGQPNVSASKASLRPDDQQPRLPRDIDAQQQGAAVSFRCQAGKAVDAVAAERSKSWYGQRVWTRAPAAHSSGQSEAPSVSVGPQAFTVEATGLPGAADKAAPANASPQSQAWKFSVMCYNILADTYAQYFAHRLYGDVPRAYLEWPHRLRLLVEEIRHWSPDVVCLQEVQHYHELEPEMRAAGYEGRFMRRTGRRRDGCATFWRSDRLRACSIQRLDFAPLGLEDNVAMLLSLAPRAESLSEEGAGRDSLTAAALSSVRLLVATTHITFDPAKGDVKLGQVRTLLSRAAGIAENPPAEEPLPLQRTSSGGHHYQQHHQHQHHQHLQHYHSQHHGHDGHQHSQPDVGSSSSSSSGIHRNLSGSVFSQQPNAAAFNQQQQHQHQHIQSRQPQSGSLQQGDAGGAAPGPGEPPYVVSSSSLPSSWWCAGAEVAGGVGGAVAAVEGRRRKAPVTPRACGEVAATADGAAHDGEAGRPGPAAPRPPPIQTLAIITGDFNSTAGSPLYHFVARGSLDLSRTNRKKLSGQLHGVCHTQYKPVSEVRQMHAQLTAASTAADAVLEPAPAAVTAAPPPAAAAAQVPDASDLAADTAIVTAVGASPPGTPPPTPPVSATVAAAATAASAAAHGAAGWPSSEACPMTSSAADAAQQLACAALDSAISACTAAAVAASSHPALASPAARAAAAIKVLDNFLHSAAAATGQFGTAHRHGGAERWSEKELRSAMGDQYDPAAVHAFVSGVGAAAAFSPSRVAPQPPPPPFTAAADRPQPRIGRQHPPPTGGRLSWEGSGGGGSAGSSSLRRSLDFPATPTMSSPASLVSLPSASVASCSGESGPLVVRHPLQLKSSYCEVARAEPAFTSLHSGFMGTVDFIWYTADAIMQQQQQPGQPQVQQQAAAPGSGAGPAAPPQPAADGMAPCGCRCAAEGHNQQLPQEQSPWRDACSSGTEGTAASASQAPGSHSGPGASAPPVPRFQLVPVAVLQPPDLELLPRGLPAAGWGSDHISVMTRFELRLV